MILKRFCFNKGPFLSKIVLMGLMISGMGMNALANTSYLPAADYPFSFVALGDNGDGSDHEKAIALQMEDQFLASPYKLVLMLGDNLYLNPDAAHPNEKPQYNRALYKTRFTEVYQALLNQGVEFKAALGNHDVREGGNEIEAERLFHMPNRFYTYQEGSDFQFFVLDTMALDDDSDVHYPDQAQLDWLDRQLKESKAKWKIVYGHYPLYSSALVMPGKSAKYHGDHPHLQAALQPLFEKYHVALYLSGHEHDYERVQPVRHVQYMVSGGGGAALGFFSLRKNHMEGGSCTEKDLICTQRAFHFIRFTQSASGLQFKVIDDKGGVLDEGLIPNPI